jgi:hypothetical protein
MAPKRQSVPIVVYAGQNFKEYLSWGMADVAAMVLLCPVCRSRLVTHDWPKRIAKTKSRDVDPCPVWIPVRELVCPACRAAGRYPRYFRVLPSFLRPFKHFVQWVRLMAFDRTWRGRERPEEIEATTGVDQWTVRVWIRSALGVLAAALPQLAADILRFEGQMPAVRPDAHVWEEWWVLGLALRAAMAAVDPELAHVPGSVLEWLTVVGARRKCWWALAP